MIKKIIENISKKKSENIVLGLLKKSSLITDLDMSVTLGRALEPYGSNMLIINEYLDILNSRDKTVILTSHEIKNITTLIIDAVKRFDIEKVDAINFSDLTLGVGQTFYKLAKFRNDFAKDISTLQINYLFEGIISCIGSEKVCDIVSKNFLRSDSSLNGYIWRTINEYSAYEKVQKPIRTAKLERAVLLKVSFIGSEKLSPSKKL